tara:strand:- start:1145 stop:1375 length:231 start_codon:yes stop_codon:yes gene_type:complete
MKITNKNTGDSFNLSGKAAADFWYSKNARGEYINKREDYIVGDTSGQISDFKYYLCLAAMMVLMVSSAFLHIHLNY